MLNYQEKMRCLPELRKSNDEFMMNCGIFYNYKASYTWGLEFRNDHYLDSSKMAIYDGMNTPSFASGRFAFKHSLVTLGPRTSNAFYFR
jgi:hypothetical protein